MEQKLRTIISSHLKKVLSFDGYTRFGVEDKAGFIRLIGEDPAFGPFHLNNDKYATARTESVDIGPDFLNLLYNFT